MSHDCRKAQVLARNFQESYRVCRQILSRKIQHQQESCHVCLVIAYCNWTDFLLLLLFVVVVVVVVVVVKFHCTDLSCRLFTVEPINCYRCCHMLSSKQTSRFLFRKAPLFPSIFPIIIWVENTVTCKCLRQTKEKMKGIGLRGRADEKQYTSTC